MNIYKVILSFIVFVCLLCCSEERAMLILYKPLDISAQCANSKSLYYDITLGMGLSDTISLVFHTLTEFDYQCKITIEAPAYALMVVVINYPIKLKQSCISTPKTFTRIVNGTCIEVCDLVDNEDYYTQYYRTIARDKLELRFANNKTMNLLSNSNVYQLTVTAARKGDSNIYRRCLEQNETLCVFKGENLCFTNGAVCDGIKNCGQPDWFDELKTRCGLPISKLETPSIITIAAVIFLIILAGTHLFLNFLPRMTHSYFIFHINEDNRLRLNPLITPPTHEQISFRDARRETTVILPMESSMSNSSDPSSISTVNSVDLKDNDFNQHSSSNAKSLRAIAKRIKNFFSYSTK